MATLATFFWRALAQPAAARSAAYQPAPVEDPFRLRALPNEDVFFYCKRIDNSRVVREANPREPRQCWSAISAACMLAVLLLGLLAPRMAGVAVGYHLQALKQEEQRLLNERHDLDVYEARLTTRKHLQELAKSRQLDTPASGQVVPLNPQSGGSLALNRH
jgi:hypothetical protein